MVDLTYAQEFKEVMSETVTVNSRTAFGGNTRNKIYAAMPKQAEGYIYRITITKRGVSPVSRALVSMLKNAPYKPIAYGTILADLAIGNSDGNSVDAFVFTNVFDADNFYQKKDNNWTACLSMTNVTNTCRAINNCVGNNLYFGFRNNNIKDGLDVKLEIVAVVNKKQINSFFYTFGIDNFTTSEIFYTYSLDNKTWYNGQTIAKGYKRWVTIAQNYMYMKAHFNKLQSAALVLYAGERYGIFWDDKMKTYVVRKY